MNRQPFQLKAPAWDAKLSPFLVRATRPLRRHQQLRQQRLLEIDVRGADTVRELFDRPAGVLLTPNHPGHADSYVLYDAADRLGRPFYFMTAWQVFAMARPFERWLYQRYGCFSVEREGSDLTAFKRAVQILSNDRHPLVIFPEGDVYHLNDRVTPLREGTAAIALTAAKHSTRPIFVVPCAIKYKYIRDPTPELQAVMNELEARVGWRPQTSDSLVQRVAKFAEAAVTLKELEYVGMSRAGSLADRVRGLMEQILENIERPHRLTSLGQSIPERVKGARRACLEAREEVGGDAAARASVDRQLQDLFFVVQLFSYPGDYVSERPSVERIAETIDKFEEDVLGYATARVRGARRGILQFGVPIDVREYSQSLVQPRKAAAPLTAAIEQAVQGLLDRLNSSVAAQGSDSVTSQSASPRVLVREAVDV